jgi:hypothetical protein
MPAPIPDLNRDQQCHHYQAPSGQRCGSPALKGEYYCYHHHLKHAKHTSSRVLIDPEITRMGLPVIEDRASIFVALAAVIHRLAENTVDTRRAGQMIYGLQTALQALPPERPHPASAHPTAGTADSSREPHSSSRVPHSCGPIARVGSESSSTPQFQSDSTTSSSERNSSSRVPHSCGPIARVGSEPSPTPQPQPDPTTPTHIPISKESLLYFLRSRHCASCNAELFPASELTERPNPRAPPVPIEESRPNLPAPGILPTLQATAAALPHREHLREAQYPSRRDRRPRRAKHRLKPDAIPLGGWVGWTPPMTMGPS